MPITRRRWLLLTIASIVNIFIGSVYAWSVFAAPLAEHLSSTTGSVLTAGDLAIAFSVANGIGPLPMILGGWVTDRFGPRFVMIVGGVLAGAGYVLAGFATSLTGLVLGYGVLFGLGLGLVYGCTVNNTLKFFPDHRGLAGGITTTCYGISSVIIAPLAATMIHSVGVTSTMVAVGVATGVVAVLGGLFSAKCPENFCPMSSTISMESHEKQREHVVRASSVLSQKEQDWRGMLSSARFWPMMGLLLCGAIAGMMILSHAHSIGVAVVGLSPAAAASAVALLAFSNMGGRLVAGFASDHLGRTTTLAIALGFSIVGLLTLSMSAGSVTVFSIGLIATGLSFGAFMGVFPGFTAEEFGSRHNAVNYALMFLGFALAGVVGPALMNAVMQGSGFSNACLTGAAVAACGFLCIALFKKTKA